MGGKKKLTLSQMERLQSRKEERKEGQRKETPPTSALQKEKKPSGIIAPDPKGKEVLSELKKMKVITPYAVASRFNLRLSIAKDLLERLNDAGLIELVSKGRNVQIYKVAG